jgi:hypothetical protein
MLRIYDIFPQRFSKAYICDETTCRNSHDAESGQKIFVSKAMNLRISADEHTNNEKLPR